MNSNQTYSQGGKHSNFWQELSGHKSHYVSPDKQRKDQSGNSHHQPHLSIEELAAERARRQLETKREFELAKKYILNFGSSM